MSATKNIEKYLEIRQGQTNTDPEILDTVVTLRDGKEVEGVLLASDIGLILWQRREAIELLTALAGRDNDIFHREAARSFLARVGVDV